MLDIEIENKITNVQSLLQNEQNTIKTLKDSILQDKNFLMEILDKMSNKFLSDDIINESYMLPQFFKSLNNAISKLDATLLILNELESTISSILFNISFHKNSNSINLEDISSQLNLYNLKKMETKTEILNNTTYVKKFKISSKPIIDEFITENEFSKENRIKKFKEDREKANIVDNTESIDNNEIYKTYKIEENNTLIISEKEEKIYLPYSLRDLSEFITEEDKSYEDIVKEHFVLPLSIIKNSSISRFKETYKLARNKSKMSIFKSFNTSVEMMFKYSLNPAIIIACKNIDELNEYLVCLKEQKLDLFKAFKIKYEINLMKI